MNCRYIYDEDGLRWEETASAVTLLVAGQPQNFRAVRNGSGLSRITRFAEKQQPHPALAGEYLYGEITEKDLGRIAEQGHIEVLLDGARVRIENTTTDSTAFVAQIKTAGGTLTRTLRAGKLGGSGRVDDADKTLRLFARMNDDKHPDPGTLPPWSNSRACRNPHEPERVQHAHAYRQSPSIYSGGRWRRNFSKGLLPTRTRYCT